MYLSLKFKRKPVKGHHHILSQGYFQMKLLIPRHDLLKQHCSLHLESHHLSGTITTLPAASLSDLRSCRWYL